MTSNIYPFDDKDQEEFNNEPFSFLFFNFFFLKLVYSKSSIKSGAYSVQCTVFCANFLPDYEPAHNSFEDFLLDMKIFNFIKSN